MPGDVFDGPFPVAKKYTLSGPATVEATTCVWIRIQDTQDTELVGELLQWMLKEKGVYPLPTCGHSGGGSYAHAFAPEDAEKILAFLRERGARVEER